MCRYFRNVEAQRVFRTPCNQIPVLKDSSNCWEEITKEEWIVCLCTHNYFDTDPDEILRLEFVPLVDEMGTIFIPTITKEK